MSSFGMDFQAEDEDLVYNLACECECLLEQISEALVASAGSAATLIDLCTEFQQRFAIWTAHLGIFARKSQCLDTRLRNHPDLQDLTARLLDILRRHLQQWRLTVATDRQRERDDESLQARLAAIDDALSRLNRLGVTIRWSSSHKADVRARKFAVGLDLTSFEQLCGQAIEALYPHAPPALKQSLGKSMADRYKRMMFSRDRHQKLKTRREPAGTLTGIPEDDAGDAVQSDQALRQPPTARTHAPPAVQRRFWQATALSQSDLSSVDTGLIRNRARPPDEASTRHPKTMSIQVKQGKYPKMPQGDKDSNFFACEWCSELLSTKSLTERDWRWVPTFPFCFLLAYIVQEFILLFHLLDRGYLRSPGDISG